MKRVHSTIIAQPNGSKRCSSNLEFAYAYKKIIVCFDSSVKNLQGRFSTHTVSILFELILKASCFKPSKTIEVQINIKSICAYSLSHVQADASLSTYWRRALLHWANRIVYPNNFLLLFIWLNFKGPSHARSSAWQTLVRNLLILTNRPKRKSTE